MSSINKYHNGRIYKIVSHQTSDIYIGSTYNSLNTRLSQHRCDYKGYLKGIRDYKTSYEILKHPDHQIILIENVKCENKEELLQKERHHIENVNCVNKCIPFRSKQEKELQSKATQSQWRDDHKEYLKEYEKNRPNIDERHRKMNEKCICECGMQSTLGHIARHKRTQKHITIINNMNNNTNVCVNISP